MVKILTEADVLDGATQTVVVPEMVATGGTTIVVVLLTVMTDAS